MSDCSALLESKCIKDWSTQDCVQFLAHCASLLNPHLSTQKLEQYTSNFIENDITGLNFVDEDSSWPILISSVGFRDVVKKKLKTMIHGTGYKLIFFSIFHVS